MDMGTNRPFRVHTEPGHQQTQRWSCVDMTSSHQSCLLKQLDEQRRQELFCDCDVLVEGHLFRAHRNVLFASSGYFRMLLSQGAKECTEAVSASFEVFSPATFTVILDFVYSGRLALASHNVIEVMSAASYLQMNNVISYCKDFIKSTLEISAKEEDDNDRYLSLSEGRFPRGDSQETSDVATLWPDSDATPKVEHPVLECDLDNAALNDDPAGAPQPTMKAEVLQDRKIRFTVQNSGRRRRGAAKRKAANATSGASSGIDLRRAAASSAQQADELYATLPTIVGVVGLFNKDSSPTMRFKCPFCTHTVKRKADLKRHLRCHTGERPYPCQACNKRFTRLEHLRSHFETIHQARKLVCRKCKRQVTEQSGRVVCEGSRCYRLCTGCIQESGSDHLPTDKAGDEPALLLGANGEEEEDRERAWLVADDDDDDLAEDSGADLIIQEVDDSDGELDMQSENTTDFL